MANVYDFTVKDRKGKDISLSQFKGKVLLIVNTATRCGFTQQYDELENMYEKYRNKDFEILDFPCNQFGAQAPGTNEDIHLFCQLNYNTKFPQFGKIDVNGENAIPLYKWLQNQKPFKGFDESHPVAKVLNDILGRADADYKNKPDIKWNFTKFLIDRDGNIVDRFEGTENLANIEKLIEKQL